MSFTLLQTESFLIHNRQLIREEQGEIKGRIKPKAEREADEKAAREAALEKSLDESNKGFKLMAKLGYKPGTTLGKTTDARSQPIRVNMKEDRGGIGLDTEKKRKFREEAEEAAKRIRADEGDYRERIFKEREEKKLEAQLIRAQKVAEELNVDAEDESANGKSEDAARDPQTGSAKPLKSINVLWRGIVRHRLEKDHERRMRRDLEDSLASRRPRYDDTEEDPDDKLALPSADDKSKILMEEDLEEDDPDLDEFNALDLKERLGKVVKYLRDTYYYCFWCKYRYGDEEMEGCPGLDEDDHD